MLNENIKQQHGVIRLSEVLELYPVSKSSWYEGVKNGKYPKPVKLSERSSAWYMRDIINLLEKLKEDC